MDTYGAGAYLRMRLPNYKSELRFWYDGETYEPKISFNLVTSFASEKGKLVLKQRLHREAVIARTVKRRLRPGTLEDRRREKLHETELMEKIKIMSWPETHEGAYVFEAPAELCEYVQKKFSEATHPRQLNSIKGRLGEMICRYVLTADWECLKDHPDAGQSTSEGCNRPGPDNYFALRPSKEPYLFEFKWYEIPRDALNRGTQQVQDRLSDKKASDSDPKLMGGYIGALNWNPRSARGSVHVKRVW